MTVRRVGHVGRVAALQALVALVAACGGSKPVSRLPTGVSDEYVGVQAAKRAAHAALPLIGYVVTELGGGSIGPFIARRGKGESATGLVAWVTGAEGSGRRILVVPVSATGQPRGGEKTAALVANDTTMLVVRPMRGPAPGFVLAWTSLTDRGESLWAAVIGDDGIPRGKAVELTRTNDDVVWVDVVPTDAGAVCVWAEETRSGDANLVAAALDGESRVRGAPVRVARGVAGWHALEIPGGVGVSTVSPPSGPKSTGAGTLSFQKLDADAHLVGPPLPITTTPMVSGDVEVAQAGGRIVFAWTDRTAIEPAVAAAVVDPKGHVEPPRRIVESRGGAALIHLAHGPAGTAIMFEAPVQKKGDRRRVHVGRIGDNLAFTGKHTSFEVFGRTPPELVATSTGFAALAAVRDCDAATAACEDVAPVATVLRLDDKAALVQKEPFTFTADPAALGWGLSCDGETCFALAASSGAPTRIRTAQVRPRSNVAAAVPPAAPSPDAPKLEEVGAVMSGEAVVDLAAAKLAEGTLLATLTTKNEKAQPLALTTRIIDESGTAAAPIVLTSRALAVGGVAVAAAERPEDGAAIAWVGRDNGDPEVHVTRVDKKGKRTSEIQLTSTKGDASDVTITWAGNGWVVAWVDGRDGNGEVYSTRIGLDLKRIGRDERVSNAPGDASDLVAHASGELVWLAWADPRESPRDGLADVFVTAVGKRDAKRAFDETRVMATAAHSRTPHLTSGAAGVRVAWIEEAPHGSETPSSSGYGAMWTTIDTEGKVASSPARIPLAGGGAASSVAIDGAGAGLHAIVARSTPDAIALDAVDLAAASPRAFPLLTLDGPPSLDVALVLHGGVILFNDDGPTPEDKRARRMRITWAKGDGSSR